MLEVDYGKKINWKIIFIIDIIISKRIVNKIGITYIQWRIYGISIIIFVIHIFKQHKKLNIKKEKYIKKNDTYNLYIIQVIGVLFFRKGESIWDSHLVFFQI